MKERKRKIEKQRRVGVNEQFDELQMLLDEISPVNSGVSYFGGGGGQRRFQGVAKRFCCPM